ncbi:MAG: hypothetical protein WKG07_43655 [Hymenobacter sp.]
MPNQFTTTLLLSALALSAAAQTSPTPRLPAAGPARPPSAGGWWMPLPTSRCREPT